MIFLPEYKKKSKRAFSGGSRAPKSKVNKQKSVSPQVKKVNYTAQAQKSDLKVVKGRKLEQMRKMRISAAFFAVVIAIIVIFELSLPIGIGDSLENFFACMGSGEFPLEIAGTDLVDAKTSNSYVYSLSNTTLGAYNSSGKEIFSYSHGFEKPIIKKSSTRVIVFEQGGKNAAIFNLSEQKSKIKTENEIITANISRCGVYAIATHSESYASTVSVYDTNDKLIYEWYSSENIVNNVIVSPNGKKIAVSTINAKNGEFVTNVSVMKFDSANALFSADFKGEVLLTLDSSHNRGFWCVSENTVKFIKWSNYKEKEFKTDYSVSRFKADFGGTVAVFNRHSDKTDSTVVLFNKSGDKKSEFKFLGSINDIAMISGHIYCISDKTVYVLDKTGKVLKSAECSFGGEKIFVIGTYDVAVMNDNTIEKIHLK